MSSIHCRDVTVELDGATILDGVSLDVGPGQWRSVVGPNGAGKSTLLRALTGVVAAGGTAEIDGRPVASMSVRERARMVAVVPQNPVMPDGMPVLDYVLLGRTAYIPYFGVESAEDVDVAKEVLSQLDLRPLAGRPLGTLSGGERQRVLLARALAQTAPVLLLDEPTTALDVGHQQEVLELVDELRRARGLTVLATMHDLTLAGQYTEGLVMLHRGRVVAEGAPEDVLTEDHVLRYYGASVRVLHEEGGIVIVPRRPARMGSLTASEVVVTGTPSDD